MFAITLTVSLSKYLTFFFGNRKNTTSPLSLESAPAEHAKYNAASGFAVKSNNRVGSE